MKNRKKNKSNILGTILFYAVVLVIWQLVYYLGTQVFELWKPYAFPNIKEIIICLGELIANGSIQNAIIASLGRGVFGYLLACIFGCVMGGLLIKYKVLRTYLKPMLMGIQTLPSVCWVPFAILWFGLGDDAIIFVVVMGSAFSIALSVESSIRNIDPLYMAVAGIMGAKGIKLATKVIIPAALPALISGFRQGWSFAWRALMSGEVISASVGLGYTLMLGRNLADINQVMLVMLIIVIIGIIIDKCGFSLVENKVLAKRGLK